MCKLLLQMRASCQLVRNMELSLHHTGAAQSRSVATDPRQREYRDRKSLRTIQKTKSRKSKEGHKRQKKVRMQAGAYIGNQFLSEILHIKSRLLSIREVSLAAERRSPKPHTEVRLLYFLPCRINSRPQKHRENTPIFLLTMLNSVFLREASARVREPVIHPHHYMAPGVKAARITCIPIGLRFDS